MWHLSKRIRKWDARQVTQHCWDRYSSLAVQWLEAYHQPLFILALPNVAPKPFSKDRLKVLESHQVLVLLANGFLLCDPGLVDLFVTAVFYVFVILLNVLLTVLARTLL